MIKPSPAHFHVFVDDNAHYMDESSRRLHGVYAGYGEAQYMQKTSTGIEFLTPAAHPGPC